MAFCPKQSFHMVSNLNNVAKTSCIVLKLFGILHIFPDCSQLFFDFLIFLPMLFHPRISISTLDVTSCNNVLCNVDLSYLNCLRSTINSDWSPTIAVDAFLCKFVDIIELCVASMWIRIFGFTSWVMRWAEKRLFFLAVSVLLIVISPILQSWTNHGGYDSEGVVIIFVKQITPVSCDSFWPFKWKMGPVV